MKQILEFTIMLFLVWEDIMCSPQDEYATENKPLDFKAEAIIHSSGISKFIIFE